jgi:hypothetical protein
MSLVAERPLRATAPVSIETTLHYTRKTGARPVGYTYEPPRGVPRYSGEVDARTVSLQNARLFDGLGLDTSGFEQISHRSSFIEWSEFQNDRLVEAIYYPEVIHALRAHTGAHKVIVFDHTLRDSSATPGASSLREPVRRVHDDQTFESAPRRLARHLPPEEAAAQLHRRYAIVNFWRPIGGPVQQAPLALCDARSIELGDLIPSDLVYRDWTGETYSFAFNPRHRWYWYPNQTADEVTLLKIYDSRSDGVARLTAHTSFDDPTSPSSPAPRRSIEVRTLVLW